MSAAVHFSPELRRWVRHNLERGCDPADLVRSMVEHRFAPEVAQGLIDAFVQARRAGAPPPEDAVALEASTVRVLARSERPVLAVLDGVLSADECDRLVALARPRLRPSTVVDPASGEDTVADYRDSEGMFFRPQENDFVARLDQRLSELMNCPLENGEGLQVLRYGPGARSEPHFDFLLPSNAANRDSIARSGQRVSTLVIYLNDVARGGETVFPAVGLSVSPKKGNAVYFEYTNSRGELDRDSLHAGGPVLEGEKWAATKWMRERRFVSL